MMEQRFYVYTLAYPDGRVFYVGKGIGNRIDAHEAEARQRHTDNPFKVAVIREIWASGEEVVKSIIAFFDDEQDAYMYEWAIMNMTTYAEMLTNINRGGGYPSTIPPDAIRRTRPSFPPLEEEEYRHTRGKHWGCFESPRRRIFHEVKDIDSFARAHKIHPHRLKDLAAGIINNTAGWTRPVRCPARGISRKDMITFESATRQPWDDQWELL